MSAKTKAKGTVKTEAIIGTASSKLGAATTNLKAAVEEASKLVEIVDEQTLRIADNEEKLAGLETEYSNKKAQQEINLKLAFQAEQKECATEYLTSNGLVAVDGKKFTELQTTVSNWETKFEEKLNAEVGKANGIAEQKIKQAAIIAESEYKAKEAGNLAEITNLKAQLEFANKQANLWKESLDSEREAGVKRAQASAVGAVNVTSSK